jgi:hypothetical protein
MKRRNFAPMIGRQDAHAMGLGSKRNKPGIEIFQLEQAKYDEDEDQQRKAGEAVYSPSHPLHKANQPAHVEAISQRARDRDAMPFPSICSVDIDRLEALSVDKSHCASLPNPQATHEPMETITTIVTINLMKRAKSFGSQRCNMAWHGQTSAMTNGKKISGAKIDCET